MDFLENHKAGFVTIVGKPNSGKSTLLNSLLGEKISIVTPKAQTTRHRILGLLNTPESQIVFSDTPGMIDPRYELQRSMMKFVSHSLEDADVILYLIDINENSIDVETVERLKTKAIPVIIVLNKLDLVSEIKVSEKIAAYKALDFAKKILPISALKKVHLDLLLTSINEFLTLHPPFYDKEDLTDRSERFIASEILREKIFLNYEQEIPYSCEIIITGFKEKEDMNVISAEIIVERDSQKGIIIGKKGEMLKKIGIEARKDMELFFGKKVFLETHVRVLENWRSNPNALKRFGYEHTS